MQVKGLRENEISFSKRFTKKISMAKVESNRRRHNHHYAVKFILKSVFKDCF